MPKFLWFITENGLSRSTNHVVQQNLQNIKHDIKKIIDWHRKLKYRQREQNKSLQNYVNMAPHILAKLSIVQEHMESQCQ